MEAEKSQVESNSIVRYNPYMNYKAYFLGFISALFVIGLIVWFYVLGKNTPIKSTVKVTPTPTIFTISPTMPPVSPTGNPTVETQEAIMDAFEKQDFSGLLDYLAPTVNVRLEASECCGQITPAATLSQLNYLKAAKAPWTFDSQDRTIASIAASKPEYYADAIVGLSDNGYVVAFKLEATGKIDTISMTSSYKLLLQ